MLAALDQRITVRYQMKGMPPEETAGYIRHHLEPLAAPPTCSPTTPSPRSTRPPAASPIVNNICLAALIATAVAGKNLVDQSAARAAIAEVTATD